MRILRDGVLAATLMGVLASTAMAQEPAAAETPERPGKGIGFQSSWPAYGLSGIYDVSETLSGQAVVGFFGGWTTLSARGLMRFSQRPQIDPYGFGMVGLWRWSHLRSHTSTVSFGGGAGIDIDLRRFAPDLPPLYWNFELGLSFVQRALSSYNGAFMTFGAGMHYRF